MPVSMLAMPVDMASGRNVRWLKSPCSHRVSLPTLRVFTLEFGPSNHPKESIRDPNPEVTNFKP